MQEPQHGDCQDLKARIEVLERCFARMREAYVKNDLGAEDYDGHRRDHAVRKQQDEMEDNYKHKFTAKAVWAALVALRGIVWLGLVEWLRAHLK